VADEGYKSQRQCHSFKISEAKKRGEKRTGYPSPRGEKKNCSEFVTKTTRGEGWGSGSRRGRERGENTNKPSQDTEDEKVGDPKR